MSFNYEYYIRGEKFPHIWCEGCGIGIMLKGVFRAFHKVGVDKNKLVVVSGIGCTSRIPGYVDANTLHTTHGRALSFATGIKLFKPELTVVCIAGDGDMAAIGGNHFIHACRRNIDITTVIYNNYNYGMTGGQHSPTTPEGGRTTTTPYGNIDPPFDLCALASGAGATFVARTTIFYTAQIEDLVARALTHKGFSVVEVVGHCHTNYGRRNKKPAAIENIEWLKSLTLPAKAAEKLPPEQREGKILTGIFKEEAREEYCERYYKMVEKLRDKKDV